MANVLGKNVDHIGIWLKNPIMSLVLDEKKHKSDASRKLFHQALNFVASNVELVTYNVVIHYGVFIVSNLTINMFVIPSFLSTLTCLHTKYLSMFLIMTSLVKGIKVNLPNETNRLSSS